MRLEHCARLDRIGPVPGQRQLQGAHCRLQGQAGELGQSRSRLHLARLHIKPLLFERPEQLLDVPALAVPVNALQGVLYTRDWVRCQQPPVNRRLFAHHAVGLLPDFDHMELDLRRR